MTNIMLENAGLKVEFQTEPFYNKYSDEIAEIDREIEIRQIEIDKLNEDIERLTNNADMLDYTVAVVSGVLCGIIDSFFVGEFSFEKAKIMGDEKMKKFVLKTAKMKGYKGNDLAQAVQYLEKEFPIAADKATNKFGGGKQHHLRDFSHHPTPVGLIFSLLTQFTGNVYGTDTAGVFHVEHLELIGSDLKLMGKNLPEKIFFGVVNWFFHMISDVVGSSTSIRQGHYGTGLPGPIVSLLKEASSLPIFKSTNSAGNKEFSVWISKLFNGTLLGKKDSNGKIVPIEFDLRTELGTAMQLGKQAIPVVINECIVRGFYFIRRMITEVKDTKISSISELKDLNWKKVLPFKNRTIVRMITIASGTFTAIDIADAAIRSGGFNPATLLRVNFVGVGRFVIAVGVDIKMGIERSRKRSERISIMNQQIAYVNAKVYYMNADTWVKTRDVAETLESAIEGYNQMINAYKWGFKKMDLDLKDIEKTVDKVREKDTQFIDECLDLLE